MRSYCLYSTSFIFSLCFFLNPEPVLGNSDIGYPIPQQEEAFFCSHDCEDPVSAQQLALDYAPELLCNTDPGSPDPLIPDDPEFQLECWAEPEKRRIALLNPNTMQVFAFEVSRPGQGVALELVAESITLSPQAKTNYRILMEELNAWHDLIEHVNEELTEIANNEGFGAEAPEAINGKPSSFDPGLIGGGEAGGAAGGDDGSDDAESACEGVPEHTAINTLNDDENKGRLKERAWQAIQQTAKQMLREHTQGRRGTFKIAAGNAAEWQSGETPTLPVHDSYQAFFRTNEAGTAGLLNPDFIVVSADLTWATNGNPIPMNLSIDYSNSRVLGVTGMLSEYGTSNQEIENECAVERLLQAGESHYFQWIERSTGVVVPPEGWSGSDSPFPEGPGIHTGLCTVDLYQGVDGGPMRYRGSFRTSCDNLHN
ncbi:hypothetical protein [Natronospira sp.]|uniref:hypothetical protein n=1 Tax=Natronospira sp. TaxID=2024970 RepID=UPI0038733251